MGSSKSLHAPSYQKFIARLRQARVEVGMTQVDLAKAVRRSQSWVSKCELGERRVDAVELEDIAKALGKPLEWFRTNTGESG